MRMLLTISRGIDAANTAIGKAAMWLVLAAVVISAGNALSRKVIGLSSNAWLEVQWHLFGAVFMLAAAYTLKRGEHVRIDFLQSGYRPRARIGVELAGHALFLMPFCLLMIWLSLPWAWASLQSGRVSANAGGLPIWPARAMVPAGFVLLALQAVSEIVQGVARLRGTLPLIEPAELAPAGMPAARAGSRPEPKGTSR